MTRERPAPSTRRGTEPDLIDPDQGPMRWIGCNHNMKSRFKLRHAIIGYVVALVFAFNALVTSVIGANVAAGGTAFALITCLGGQVPEQVPGQPDRIDHAGKCACSLSSCCCAGALVRNAGVVGVTCPITGAAVLQNRPHLVERNFHAYLPLHLRSPPDTPLKV